MDQDPVKNIYEPGFVNPCDWERQKRACKESIQGLLQSVDEDRITLPTAVEGKLREIFARGEDKTILDALVELLAAQEDDVRVQASRSLELVNPKSDTQAKRISWLSRNTPELLLRAFHDPVPEVRRNVLLAAEKFGDVYKPAEFFSVIPRLLREEDARVLMAVITAVPLVGVDLASTLVPNLVELLEHTSPEIRVETCKLLKWLGRDALPAIYPLIGRIQKAASPSECYAATSALVATNITGEELLVIINSDQRDAIIGALRDLGQVGRELRRQLMEADRDNRPMIHGENVLRRFRGFWNIRFAGGEPFLMKDLVGLSYIKAIVQKPGHDFQPNELIGMRDEYMADAGSRTAASGVAEGTEVGHVTHGDDRRDFNPVDLIPFNRRLEGIDDELQEARENNNEGAIERLEKEREDILAEIKRYTTSRRSPLQSDLKRNRDAVRNAITNAIEAIPKEQARLRNHLRPIVRSGHFRYSPETLISWEF